MAVTKAKKKVVKKVSHGIAHVVATNNNTRITITDQSGAVLTWATAGANNFKGAKKSTPYAATVVADAVGKKVAEMGMKTVDVLMRGIGQGRESAVRGLANAGLIVQSITDTTRIPHNGIKYNNISTRGGGCSCMFEYTSQPPLRVSISFYLIFCRIYIHKWGCSCTFCTLRNPVCVSLHHSI